MLSAIVTMLLPCFSHLKYDGNIKKLERYCCAFSVFRLLMTQGSSPGRIPHLRTSSPVCKGFLRFTKSADFLTPSIAANE